MKIKIQPLQSFLGSVDAIDIVNCNVSLGSTASVSYSLLGGGAHVHHGHITMSPDEYAQWGTDDNFVAEIVANKLGATIVEILPPYQVLPVDAAVVSPPAKAG